MSDGAFSARGDNGVLFVSALDQEQSIQAGSISLGNGAPNPAKNHGSLLRNGDLRLTALNGSVVIGRGQRLVANGALNVSAKVGVTLADTAALSVGIRSSTLAVYAGSTVQGNSISVSARPTVIGGGGATFAVPNRTEVSNSVPSDDVLVRGLTRTAQPLSFASLRQPDPTFPLTPRLRALRPDLPPVTGSALFDYARVIPRMDARPRSRARAQTRTRWPSHGQERPLWAEELLAYLEQQSTDTPNEAGALAEADLLPPVGARPGEPIAPNDARVRNAAVQSAVAHYRNLFRPDLRRDPETRGDRARRVSSPRSARRSRRRSTPCATRTRDGRRRRRRREALRERTRSTPRPSATASSSARCSTSASARLTPEQRPRFRALLLSDVTPYGISPAEFETLF